MNDLYHEQIIEEAKHPQNYGQLEEAERVIPAKNASCGDQATFYLTFNPDKTIKDVKWVGQGCVISQAALSVTSELIKGKTLAQLKNITQQEIEQVLGIENISLGRVKCLLFGLNTLKGSE